MYTLEISGIEFRHPTLPDGWTTEYTEDGMKIENDSESNGSVILWVHRPTMFAIGLSHETKINCTSGKAVFNPGNNSVSIEELKIKVGTESRPAQFNSRDHYFELRFDTFRDKTANCAVSMFAKIKLDKKEHMNLNHIELNYGEPFCVQHGRKDHLS